MTAGKAYIASFGTTGVLVGLAVLLLVVVGALMAFDGDRDGDSSPAVTDVFVNGPGIPDAVAAREPVRPSRAADAAVSTTGVEVVPAAAPPVLAVVEVPLPAPDVLATLPAPPVERPPVVPPARAPATEAPADEEDGTQLDGGVDELPGPELGETVDPVIEDVAEALPEQEGRGTALTPAESPPER